MLRIFQHIAFCALVLMVSFAFYFRIAPVPPSNPFAWQAQFFVALFNGALALSLYGLYCTRKVE